MKRHEVLLQIGDIVDLRNDTSAKVCLIKKTGDYPVNLGDNPWWYTITGLHHHSRVFDIVKINGIEVEP